MCVCVHHCHMYEVANTHQRPRRKTYHRITPIIQPNPHIHTLDTPVTGGEHMAIRKHNTSGPCNEQTITYDV